MHQSRGLLRAGMQEAINGNGRGFIGIGEAVRTAHAQALVTARDKMVHAEMFEFQRGHRGPAAISAVAAKGLLRGGWPALLPFGSLFFVRELLHIVAHQVHGSQGLELRVRDATHAVDPFGVDVSRQHIRTLDASPVRGAASADSGNSAS